MSARIVAVVGAGGKSSYIEREAARLAAAGERVAVTTTTHIHAPENEGRDLPYDVVGLPCEDGKKLTAPGSAAWERMKREYDVIFAEADGARHHPVKVPAAHEPVIPADVSEIVAVMGAHGEGRPLREACFRYELLRESPEGREILAGAADAPGGADGFGSIRMTAGMIRQIAQNFYMTPLSQKYPAATCRFYYSDMFQSRDSGREKTALVLLASGAGRRFGANKLLEDLEGQPLYSFALRALLGAREMLREDGIASRVFAVSCYPEILDPAEKAGARPVMNTLHEEGMAASIRLGARAAAEGGFGSVLFLAADQPLFPAEDIARLVREYAASGKQAACAFSDHPGNPGLFSAQLFPFLQSLSGEQGPVAYIRAHPSRVHYFTAAPEKLFDVDTAGDIAAAAAALRTGYFIA